MLSMLVMQFIGLCAARSAALSTDEPALGPGPLISLVVKYKKFLLYRGGSEILRQPQFSKSLYLPPFCNDQGRDSPSEQEKGETQSSQSVNRERALPLSHSKRE